MGDEFVVKLDGQPSTGYAWQVVSDANGLLKTQGEPTTQQSGDAARIVPARSRAVPCT